jgi:hypothetical protein
MAVKYFDRVKETTTTTGTSDAALAGAASGYRAFSSVLSDGDLCYYCMEVASGGAWEMGIGTYSSMGNIARTVILSSSNSNSIVSFSAGTKNIFMTVPAQAFTSFSYPPINGFRLSAQTSTPVSTSDQGGAFSVYLTPYTSTAISVPNSSGTDLVVMESSEISFSLSMAGLSAATNYDVYAYNSGGTLTLAMDAGWMSDTLRMSSFNRLRGLLVNSGTVGSCAANCGLYVGTFRTSDLSGTTLEDTKAKRYIWNMFNRVPRFMSVVDTTNSWTYSTSSYRAANNTTNNRVAYVHGMADVLVEAIVKAYCLNGTAGFCAAGVGVDSTTTNSCQTYGGGVPTTATTAYDVGGVYKGYPGLGYHTLQWIELGRGSGTTTWYGDNNLTYLQSGLTAVSDG